MKKQICLIAIFFASTFLFARNLKSFVGEENAKQLSSANEKTIIDFHENKDENSIYKLLPNSQFASLIKENAFPKNEGYFIECLYFINENDLRSENEKPAIDTSINVVSKIVRSISKMQGMTYRTEESGAEKILYKRTYTMKSETDESEVPDKITGSADGLKIFVFQHDRVLGACKYEVNYHETADEIFMTFLNITPMNFGFIKTIDTKKFRSNMLVSKCDEGFLVYIAAQADRKRIAFLNRAVNKLFYARLNALYNWFCKQF